MQFFDLIQKFIWDRFKCHFWGKYAWTWGRTFSVWWSNPTRVNKRTCLCAPTNIFPGLRPGLCPEVQTQTDGHGHAGDLLPSSLAVLVKDVDLLGFKGYFSLNLHHTARPAGRKHAYYQRSECFVYRLGVPKLWRVRYYMTWFYWMYLNYGLVSQRHLRECNALQSDRKSLPVCSFLWATLIPYRQWWLIVSLVAVTLQQPYTGSIWGPEFVRKKKHLLGGDLSNTS